MAAKGGHIDFMFLGPPLAAGSNADLGNFCPQNLGAPLDQILDPHLASL